MSSLRLPGNRIVKTTVAVFLTAFICILIGWPPVFAVITAIVTLEPTVKDSIKKGMVRFPASAIGSFYAVLFISLFGNSAITYTLAASLTIITCYRLKLYDGLLVATITAVAMVEVVIDNYFLSFFIRLGTTSIGIIVSTLVNMFIFPPKYMKVIETNMKDIYIHLGKALQLLNNKPKLTKALQLIKKKITSTEQLIRYEVDEVTAPSFFEKEKRDQSYLLEDINHMELIHYHIHNLQAITLKDTAFSDEQLSIINDALLDLRNNMTGKTTVDLTQHEIALKELMRMFWRSDHEKETLNHSLLPDELIFLYETIAIFALVKDNKLISINEKS